MILLTLFTALAMAGPFRMEIPATPHDPTLHLVNTGNAMLALRFTRLLDSIDPKYRLALNKMVQRPDIETMPASDHLIKRLTLGYSAAADYGFIHAVAVAALATAKDQETKELAEQVAGLTTKILSKREINTALEMSRLMAQSIGEGQRSPEMIWPVVQVFAAQRGRDERFVYLRLPKDIDYTPILKAPQILNTAHVNGIITETNQRTIETIARHFSAHPVNKWPNLDWLAMIESGSLLTYRMVSVMQKYEPEVIRFMTLDIHHRVRARLQELLGLTKVVKEP